MIPVTNNRESDLEGFKKKRFSFSCTIRNLGVGSPDWYDRDPESFTTKLS